jgi:hypothetical protein
MHRLLMTYDPVPAPEFHLPSCVGGSFSLWLHVIPVFQKHALTVEVGPIPTNNPLGMGHDTGILRPHVLVCVPDPTLLASGLASAAATVGSSCKPMFNAHKVQVGVSGASLPVCADPLPFCVTIGGGIVCSFPGLPTALYPPTEFTVFVGLTLGDLLGGIMNAVAESAFQGVFNAIGFGAGAIGKGLAKSAPKLAQEVIEAIAGCIPGLATTAGGAFNLNTGFSNPGRVLQEDIDRDGVGSDAHAAFTVFGFGVSRTSSSPGGTDDRVGWATPWSPTPSAEDSWEP